MLTLASTVRTVLAIVLWLKDQRSIYSHCLLMLNISSKYTDFGVNSKNSPCNCPVVDQKDQVSIYSHCLLMLNISSNYTDFDVNSQISPCNCPVVERSKVNL